ncbi:MAG TPA: branched-chain amino acid ABC transporter permease [Acetobacteraceae bacterium]|jgi:branched-chain amino acid transport system permease protein|nr:branched-chain amino acid ABC transporter permease [Acetobacteraceae bacterium]
MGLLAQALASGVVTGAIYALIALSLVIVYKSTDVINFAGGDVLMASCYVALLALISAGLPYWASALAAVGAAAVIGAGFDRLVLERIGRSVRGQDVLVAMVTATIGLSYVLKGAVRLLSVSSEVRSLPSQFLGPPIILGSVILLRQDIGILATAAITGAALFAFYRFTRLGRGMRAVAEDPRAAALIGIPIVRMRMLSWAVACAVAAVAGLLVAPKILMTPDMGIIVILAFAAAVIGGFTNFPGVVIGGLLLGIIENLVACTSRRKRSRWRRSSSSWWC